MGADNKQECGQPEENWDWNSDRGAKGPEGETGQYWSHFKSNWKQSQQHEIDDFSKIYIFMK